MRVVSPLVTRRINASELRLSACIVACSRSMPAARASAASRSARIVPTPRCCHSSTTANATSASAPSRTRRAIPIGVPWTSATSDVVVGVDAASAASRSAGAQRGLGAPEPEQRESAARAASKTDWTTAAFALPERPDRDPSDHFRVHGPSMSAGHGPPHRPDGPSLRHGPSGPLRLAYMDQEIRFLDFEGAAARLLEPRRRPADRLRAALGQPSRRGVGRPSPAGRSTRRSRRRTACCASTASAAGSRHGSSSRARPSRPSRVSSKR